MDEGVFGAAEACKTLNVDEYGPRDWLGHTARDGRYFVSVGASGANAETIVACGNLAAPTQ